MQITHPRSHMRSVHSALPVLSDNTVMQQEQRLESDALLRGNKSVTIAHNGAIYRLQATKLGKLILTK